MKKFLMVYLVIANFSLAAGSYAAGVQVLTQHNDPQRTGTNVTEEMLTPANVGSSGFDRLGSYAVSGQVFAQPLFTSIDGDHRLYIATARNLVYAFNADQPNSDPIWTYDAGSDSTALMARIYVGRSPDIFQKPGFLVPRSSISSTSPSISSQ